MSGSASSTSAASSRCADVPRALAAERRVHVLVNNAGGMTQERALSADGVELHGRDERGPLDASGPVGHSRCAIVGVSLLQGDPAAAQNREGADTIAWRALRPNRAMRSSRVWHDRRPRPKDLLPCTRETPQERERRRAESERLTGWQDPRTLVAARSNR